MFFHHEDTNDCKDAGGRQKTAPAFSAFATSLWFSNAGAIAESTEKKHKLLVLLVLRVFVVNKKIGDAGYVLRWI
jgi:hypothetical protein